MAHAESSCSSSTISGPRSRSFTSLCSGLCVPIRAYRSYLGGFRRDFASALWRCESGTASQCVYRPVGETVAEVVIVLLRQQRGRHQYRYYLFMVFTAGTRRASPLRFCRSRRRHTPAAIHRQRLAHIAQYGVNRLCPRSGVVSNGKLSQNN